MDNTLQHNNLLKAINELEDYAFLFLDLEGNVQSWNSGAQKIKGYTREEILGKNFRLFYTQEDNRNKKPDRLIEAAKKNGKAQDEGWRVRKDGTTFWGNVTITAVHDENGKIIGFGKFTKDLTEKKLAEQLLLQKNKELEQFNFIASHDLQEPLRTVSNYVQILEEDYFEQLPQDAKKHLKTIAQATERMSNLVRSLLDFSQLGREKKIVSVNCRSLIENITSDLNALLVATKSIITTDKLPIIDGIETELRQLFQNLITNAIKFRKNEIPVEIKIAYFNRSKHHEFHVQDNGIGIEQKNFDKIFQFFQKLNREDKYEGYGIGLAYCKKIVEIHGGILWVESEFGKGSIFKFTIQKNLL